MVVPKSRIDGGKQMTEKLKEYLDIINRACNDTIKWRS